MARMMVILIVFLVATLVPGSATASNASGAWALVDAPAGQAMSAHARMTTARDLAKRIGVLQRVIPDQSARARKRTQRKLEALDDDSLGTKARGDFFLSLDYQHHQLLGLLAQAQTALQCVLDEAPGTLPASATEVRCWVQLAEVLFEEDRIEMGLGALRRRKMIPKDDDMPRVAQDPRIWYAEFGRGILRSIVEPHLAALAAATGPLEADQRAVQP